MSERPRERWRMTLDELVYATKTSPVQIEEWAQLGAYGDRWKEPRDRGKYRHISREMAQRAVIMSRLVDAGVNTRAAAAVSVLHKTGNEAPLIVQVGKVTFEISRENLP